MKVLIIGSGGREHAIAYALNKSEKVDEIHAIPGNPGIAEIGTCFKGNIEDNYEMLRFVEEHDIDFTVIGPEVPLCNGLADVLEDKGHKVFGPKKYAATLEGSKAFSKDFMYRHNIPTAAYKEVNSYDEAVEALKDFFVHEFSYPVVVKADGLAAGKGVVICEDEQMAKDTLKEMMKLNSNEMLNFRKVKDYYDYNHLLKLYFNPYLLYGSRFSESDLDFFIDFTINRYEEEISELKFMKEDGQINSGEFKKLETILNEKYFTGSFIATNIYRIRENRNREKVKSL